MALVKVIGIHDKPKATIKYIKNSEKTMGGELVTGINTLADLDVAANKMEYYRRRYQNNNSVKAFHIVHSFSSEENLSPELAHQISLEWFEKVFPETTIAVAATHTDTGTIHTHFLVNNITIDGSKIRTDKSWIKNAVEVSNDICNSYKLNNSIVNRGSKSANKVWYEYQQEKLGNSWKEKIRKDIDALVPKVKDIEQLYSLLEQQGYTVKTDRKYVSVRPQDKERFVRLKNLGYNYSPEQLQNRILGISEYDLDGIGYKNYSNNKWIDKDVYKYKFKKASIGAIIQLTGKIIATQLNIYSNDKRYTRHNFKAEKELLAIEKALRFVQENKFETREELVAVYNNLEIELEKINKWKSKAQKKIDEVILIADEINKLQHQLDLVNIKEQEYLSKHEDLKSTMYIYDKCRCKEYDKLYNNKENEPSR